MGQTELFAMTGDLGRQINNLSVRVVVASAIALFLLVFAAAFAKGVFSRFRPLLFTLIAFTITVSTLTLFGSAIYISTKAESNGPVRWSSGIEFWACGVQLEIQNPNSVVSNKIGTPTIHEHDDQIIHVEGMVINKPVEATLGKFMRVIGGDISDKALNLPVADSVIENSVDGDSTDPAGAIRLTSFITGDATGKRVSLKKGDVCDRTPGEVQAYIYTYHSDNNTYVQQKISNPESYIIDGTGKDIPSSCIIVEFGPPKSRTDRLCKSYGVHDDKRCIPFGVKAFSEHQCYIREVLPTFGGRQ